MRTTIRTFSGRFVDPTNLKLEDICIEDIAHHLSLTCRYAGACPEFYSVAQHSVIVAIMMDRAYGHKKAALAGLFHDASEAYLHDITSPVKHAPFMAGYREAEDKATATIFEKFNVNLYQWYPLVKPFDTQAYKDETASFWEGANLIMPCPPKEAKEIFLAAYRNFQ